VEAQSATFTEDFEDDADLDPPESDFYVAATTGTIQFHVSTEQAHAGTKSLKLDTNDATAAWNARFALDFNLCLGGEVDFWFRVATLSSWGTALFTMGLSDMADGDTSGGEYAIFEIDPALNLVARVNADPAGATGSGTPVSMGVIAVNTWYHFGIRDIDCALAKARFLEFTTGLSFTVDGAGSWPDLDHFIFTHTVVSGNHDVGTQPFYFDNFNFTDVLPAAVGVTATVAVVDLSGFDADPTGNTLIARTLDGGPVDSVRTYNGGTLAALGVAETDCNRIDGVSAYSTHVSYFKCNPADASDVTELRIRNSNLANPSQPSVCSSFCVHDIDDEELSETSEDANFALATVTQFPFDYNSFRDGPFIEDAVYMAWGFTSTNGDAGIFTFTMNNNGDDTSTADTISMGSSLPNQICVIQDGDGQTWFYAGSSESNVKGARVDFRKITPFGAGLGAEDTLEVSLVQVFSGTASTAGPLGVACGDGKFAILNADKITLWQRGANGPYKTISGITGVTRGIHMSLDGKWLAYVDGTNWRVAPTEDGERPDGTEYLTGETVAGDALPSGDFRRLYLHGRGSVLWIATDTSINAYGTLFEATSGEDLSISDGSIQDEFEEDNPTPGGGSGTLGTRLFPNGNPQVVMLIGSVATILILALAAWGFTGRRKEG